MKDRNVLSVVVGSLWIGLLVDGLLRIGPWGLGFVVVILIALAAGASVGVRAGHRINMRAVALAVGVVSCAAMLAVRDSATLVALDLVVGLALLVVIPATILGARLDQSGPVEWLLTVLVTSVDSVFGSIVFLVRDFPWLRIRQARVGRPALAFARGAILAAPPLIVFGALLSSADAVFSKLLAELIDIDLEIFISHLLFFGIGTWLAMGWLARAGGDRALPGVSLEFPGTSRLGLGEIALVLGSIDVLFFGFVVIQLRYFFGGADVIEAVPGLTRAEYARSGFFQLVTVAALVVVLLLFADWIVDRSARTLRWSRVLAAVQIGLVLVMLVSAWLRMQLYVEEYGLTELRLYTSAFMILLGAVLVWFCATVLVGRRGRFASGAIALGVTGLIALNLVNPEELIVRTNVRRALMGRTFDAEYLNQLSTDAVPAIVESLDLVTPEQRRILAEGLESRAIAARDWRTWNVSRMEARRMLGSIRERRRPGSFLSVRTLEKLGRVRRHYPISSTAVPLIFPSLRSLSASLARSSG